MHDPIRYAAGIATALREPPPVSRLDKNMRPSQCLGIGIPLGLSLWLLIGSVVLAAVS